ncbi:hypothetical protein JTB14_031828 [Gonioctena quinquepunctata]|nr:hypothetical protein JTB14_031828 [Gonioctena quinquepunctata]
MHLAMLEMYDKCADIWEQHKVPFHTYDRRESKEIRAIFNGVAEDIHPDESDKELINEGFTPRVVARFMNREGRPMPIILVIVPGTQYECTF